MDIGFWWIYPIILSIMTGNRIYNFLFTQGLEYSKFTVRSDQYPIFYSYEYNMGMNGLESFFGANHPFDLQKFSKIQSRMLYEGIIQRNEFLRPPKPSYDELLTVHTPQYLESLNSSQTVARIAEVGPIALFPSILVKYLLLNPMLYSTGGTVLAGKAALQRGWAINLGGGYHHASSNKGEGFSVYGDITMSIRFLQKFQNIKRVMIIDLDAHQGNGFEKDFLKETNNVYIVDAYVRDNYPRDEVAKDAIRKKIELEVGTDDKKYIPRIKKSIDEAFEEFSPEIVFYNAGTDILIGDPLGKLAISKEGIIERDELVWKKVLDKKIPIVMTLSGGYHEDSAEVVANSIINLNKKFGLMKQARNI